MVPVPWFFSGFFKEVLQLFVSPNVSIYTLVVENESGQVEEFGTTYDHPFWVRGKGWIDAEKLLPGDELFSSQGRWLKVSYGTWVSERQTVYNFQVEDYHTYFVGGFGVWVHNSDCVDLAEDYAYHDKKAMQQNGWQDHHVVSDKNKYTKDHDLLELSGSQRIGVDGEMKHAILQEPENKIMLPKNESLDSVKSIHNGKHVNNVSSNLAKKMDQVVQKGKKENWNEAQYKKELNNIQMKERKKLESGERALNKNKRDWAEDN